MRGGQSEQGLQQGRDSSRRGRAGLDDVEADQIKVFGKRRVEIQLFQTTLGTPNLQKSRILSVSGRRKKKKGTARMRV